MVAAVAFGVVPALPMMAYRLARLPVPSIPTGPEDLKTDSESVDGRQVLQQSERADQFLTGLLWTVSLLVLGAQFVLALDGRLPAVLLCLVLALLALLRARPSWAGPSAPRCCWPAPWVWAWPPRPPSRVGRCRYGSA